MLPRHSQSPETVLARNRSASPSKRTSPETVRQSMRLADTSSSRISPEVVPAVSVSQPRVCTDTSPETVVKEAALQSTQVSVRSPEVLLNRSPATVRSHRLQLPETVATEKSPSCAPRGMVTITAYSAVLRLMFTPPKWRWTLPPVPPRPARVTKCRVPPATSHRSMYSRAGRQ